MPTSPSARPAHPANALAAERSPYLRQHAYNPVRWQPWGEAAWDQARREGKLVLISIGYSACHWCHVMERECFENEALAELMNRHYVCIKVDREERPDVDAIYMDAVQLMRGSGGWPLNCFTLPDGRPLYGGTYFPPAQWARVLTDLADFYQREPAKADTYAAELTQAIAALDRVVAAPTPGTPTRDDLVRHYIHLSERIDRQRGGTLGAPKFPVPSTWRWLLRYAHHSQDAAARQALDTTLQGMARGGIYDAVGGGFARYSVDDRWHVPHFEKMLYDNAQLVSLYAEAYRLTGAAEYAQVVSETLAFVGRELTHPAGGFYSALDADSEGVEGKFYVFAQAEIDQACGPRAPLITLTYNTTAEGNWEHGLNVLTRSRSAEATAQLMGLPLETYQAELARALGELRALRDTRVRPGLDDKVLTGWNALMTLGYLDAYRALGTPAYLEAALANQRFVESNLADGPRLDRVWADGSQAAVNAYLDDYAYTLEALVQLYQVSFDPQWLRIAEARMAYVLTHFAHPETGLCYFTSELDPPLIARKQEVTDSVTPSANAALAHALLSLGTLLDRPEWQARARQMHAAVLPLLRQHPTGFSHWGLLEQRWVFADRQVALVGPEAQAWRAELDRRYLPGLLTLGAEAPTAYPPLLEGKGAAAQSLAFVCQGRTCSLPIASLEGLLAALAG